MRHPVAGFSPSPFKILTIKIPPLAFVHEPTVFHKNLISMVICPYMFIREKRLLQYEFKFILNSHAFAMCESLNSKSLTVCIYLFWKICAEGAAQKI